MRKKPKSLPNRIFNFAILASIAAGVYGYFAKMPVIYIPYIFINPAILIIFGSLRKIKSIESITTNGWQEKIRLFAASILLLNIPGSIYLYEAGIQYDIPLHFLALMIIAVALGLLYPVFFYKFQNRLPSLKHILVAIFILTTISGIAAEGVQKLSDEIFGTKLFFDTAQPIVLDVTIDIAMNIAGTLVGLFYLLRNKSFIWRHLAITKSTPINNENI